MATFALTPYVIRIRDTSISDEFVALDKFDGTTHFSTVFEDFLLSLKLASMSVDSTTESVLQYSSFVKDCDAMNKLLGSFCILKSGSYGYESELLDVDSGVSRPKSKKEAEVFPFGIYLEHPALAAADEAIVIFQSFKRYGIATLFWSKFSEYFHAKFPRYKIQMGKLIPPDVMKEMLKKSVQEIKFIQYDTSVLQKSMDSGHKENETKMTVSFSGNSIPIFDKLMHAYNRINRNLITDVFEFSGQLSEFTYDSVKIVIKDGNLRRTINLSDFTLPNYRIDIDSEIESDITGFPKEDNLKEILRQNANDLRVQMMIK